MKLTAEQIQENWEYFIQHINTWIDEQVFFEYELIFDLSSYFTQPFKFSLCTSDITLGGHSSYALGLLFLSLNVT